MKDMNRRTFVKGALTISAGMGAGVNFNCSTEEQKKQPQVRNETLPMLKIGNHQITRMIVGGNPFSYNAHAEPLVYVGRLFRQYFTHEKTVETMSLCVKHGINTFLGIIDYNVIVFLKLFEKTTGEKMPWIGQTSKKPQRGASKQQVEDNIKFAADNGAIGCYIQGQSCDYLVENNKLRDLEEYVTIIRELGMIAGLGAHHNKTIDEIITKVSKPDFYMKTFNNVDYCTSNYKETAEIMSKTDVPWIAFKVLGAGRAKPKEGFKLALDAGAEFLCVGMFDFQVEDNVTLMRDLLTETES